MGIGHEIDRVRVGVFTSRSDDGRLDVKLSRPGTSSAGTNPEQLLAAGWSACHELAMEHVARRARIALPTGLAVGAEVDLGPNRAGYDVPLRLNAEHQPARHRARHSAAPVGGDARGVSMFSWAIRTLRQP
jgi:organic hydroperoxide reductase OsmC/OhrA